MRKFAFSQKVVVPINAPIPRLEAGVKFRQFFRELIAAVDSAGMADETEAVPSEDELSHARVVPSAPNVPRFQKTEATASI
jgi:hypothetical protein